MKTTIFYLYLMTLLFFICQSTASASVLDFENVPGANPATSSNSVRNGYGGLKWKNLYVMHPSTAVWYEKEMYEPCVASGEWVTYNYYQRDVTISGSSFTFNGAYFAIPGYIPYQMNGKVDLLAIGKKVGVEIYRRVFSITEAKKPIWFQFDFVDIDELVLSSGGEGVINFAMDDFTYNEEPVVANGHLPILLNILLRE